MFSPNIDYQIIEQIIIATIKAVQEQEPADLFYKISEEEFPEPFSGKLEDLDVFINANNLLFDNYPRAYNTDERKVVFALSLMEKGLAKVWKQRYIAAREGQSIAPNNDWSQFVQIL